MKTLLITFGIVFSVFAMAQVPSAPPISVIVTGQGSASGLCNGQSTVYNCYKNIEQRAVQDGTANTQQTCWARGGQSDFPFCHTECDPSDLPAGAPNQRVTCQAHCTANCQIH